MLTKAAIERVVAAALDEDAPWGDITSEALIPADATADARLVARERGVFSGGAVFAAAFRQLDPDIRVHVTVADGEVFEAGAELGRVTGPARAVLTAERAALNLTQRMCGVSTLTARYVAAVAGPPRASRTHARPLRGCARSNGMRCAQAAGTTTASHCPTR